MFSNILIKLRKDAGYTQAELANLLGMGKSAISNYESGFRTPENETLIKLSKIFNVSIETLLGVSSSEQSFRYINKSDQTKIIHYSGNDRINSIIEEMLNLDLTNDDLKLIEFILDKYKK